MTDNYPPPTDWSIDLETLGAALVLTGLLTIPIVGAAAWLTAGLIFWTIVFGWAIAAAGLLLIAGVSA